MRELVAKVKEAREKLTALESALRAVQTVCEHDWKDDGHDSHYDYDRCVKCDAVRQS